MTARFNHTIVNSRDNEQSAQFFSEIFGLPRGRTWGPFTEVVADNDVTVAFINAGDHDIAPQHYAFIISEEEFDTVLGRVRERGLDYWADPHKQQPNDINHDDGGRAFYFDDIDGHLLEVMTVPYGGGTSP